MTVTRADHAFTPPSNVVPLSETSPAPGVTTTPPVTPEVSVPPTTPSVPATPPSDLTGGNIDFEMLRAVFNLNFNFNFGGCGCNHTPTQCVPQPSDPSQGSAPPGKGLTQNEDGSITTAGGYKIKAEGDKSTWKIWGPDGKELTKVWGDPHVKEGDGTKWDFTKSSNFVLPDGTRIHCKTTAETGKSVSEGLDIANGSDRFSISGVNTKNPQTTQGTGGVAAFQQEHGARDTFNLKHDANSQEWVKYDPKGQLQGVVTGADLKNNQYVQRTNGKDSTLPGGDPNALGGLTRNPDGSVSTHPMLGQHNAIAGPGGGSPLAGYSGINGLGGMGSFGGLEQLFGMGGLDQLFGLGGMGGVNGLGGMGGLEQLLGLGGMGGLGQTGQSPFGALMALAMMNSLMSGGVQAQAQLDYFRYNHTFR